MRPHQWVKNAFVLAPLFFTPEAQNAGNILATVIAALCFCAASSAVYILNDWRDREADRLHPDKRSRPLAAGTVDERTALIAMAALAAGAVIVGALVSTTLLAFLLAYLAMQVGYCLYFKHVSIVDVLALAVGFVLRVEAGAAVASIKPSVWIVICSGLLALFLAIAKRRDDLVRELDDEHRRSLSGYTRPFLDAALAMVLGALLVSYLIYTTDQQVIARLGENLYLTTPFVVGGILRYLQIALVEERSGSPTRIVLTDPFMIVCVVGWAVAFAAVIYG